MGKLTLTRRKGESIIIDNKIRITVMVIDDVPKLVIEAPKEVKVLREEALSSEDLEQCKSNGLDLKQLHGGN